MTLVLQDLRAAGFAMTQAEYHVCTFSRSSESVQLETAVVFWRSDDKSAGAVSVHPLVAGPASGSSASASSSPPPPPSLPKVSPSTSLGTDTSGRQQHDAKSASLPVQQSRASAMVTESESKKQKQKKKKKSRAMKRRDQRSMAMLVDSIGNMGCGDRKQIAKNRKKSAPAKKQSQQGKIAGTAKSHKKQSQQGNAVKNQRAASRVLKVTFAQDHGRQFRCGGGGGTRRLHQWGVVPRALAAMKNVVAC